MLAFATLSILLATAGSIVASPLHRHHGRDRSVARAGVRRSCKARNGTSTTTTTSFTPHTTTTSVASHTTSHASDSKAAALNLVWPLSISNAKASWSTSSQVTGNVPLNDASLNIFSYARTGTNHTYTKAPDGTASMKAVYEAGSIAPGEKNGLIGGFDIYALTSIDLTKGTEVLFSYKAWFEKGFDFQKGGKMPGLFLGTSNAVAKECSGGEHADGDCASSRLMWRPNGAGELYAYFPESASNTAALKTAGGKLVANDVYGTSVGRGLFSWSTGSWTAVAQRLKLNDVGSANGEFQLWVNGVSVMNIKGLTFRTSSKSLIRGLQLETFFGGHDNSWASPKDQSCWFKDFSAALLT
ncbi:hypothetical protein DL93DRAFT_1467680 [Clavulina sp. PMI_390]|nr:hypothetical protein DL93DRAFT_1467680 [Clavulina sp. PMI_390]